MPHYQFSIQFRDQPPSPLKAVELADESKARTTGKQVVELLVARLEGNPQLASATLISNRCVGFARVRVALLGCP